MRDGSAWAATVDQAAGGGRADGAAMANVMELIRAGLGHRGRWPCGSPGISGADAPGGFRSGDLASAGAR